MEDCLAVPVTKYLIIIFLFLAYSYSLIRYGELKQDQLTQKTTTKETVREVRAAGSIEAGDAHHAPRVQADTRAILTAPGTIGCGDVDMPDVDIARLGGVHN